MIERERLDVVALMLRAEICNVEFNNHVLDIVFKQDSPEILDVFICSTMFIDRLGLLTQSSRFCRMRIFEYLLTKFDFSIDELCYSLQFNINNLFTIEEKAIVVDDEILANLHKINAMLQARIPVESFALLHGYETIIPRIFLKRCRITGLQIPQFMPHTASTCDLPIEADAPLGSSYCPGETLQVKEFLEHTSGILIIKVMKDVRAGFLIDTEELTSMFEPKNVIDKKYVKLNSVELWVDATSFTPSTRVYTIDTHNITKYNTLNVVPLVASP
jgi:hypothetical protein